MARGMMPKKTCRTVGEKRDELGTMKSDLLLGSPASDDSCTGIGVGRCCGCGHRVDAPAGGAPRPFWATGPNGSISSPTGYFASIIAMVFFRPTAIFSLMLTYATFAVGLWSGQSAASRSAPMRDRYGRQRALALLIGMMGARHADLGLTPAYASIGIIAPIIVVLGACGRDLDRR